jgi:vacuolar-type H+-ATPase subunit F/Vma7
MAVATGHQVAAIGSEADVAGLALAGVRVVPAATTAGTRQAWDELPAEVAVVLLTPQAAAELGDARFSSGSPLSVVLASGSPPSLNPDPDPDDQDPNPDPDPNPDADQQPATAEESAGG